jgi:Spy/CpxP family protein refolding chaperone
MRKTLILGAALALASSLAAAQGMMGGGMMGGGMMGSGQHCAMGQHGEMFGGLNLTDEQRQKVLAIQEEHRKKMSAVLTPEQRKLLRQHGPWWLRDDHE